MIDRVFRFFCSLRLTVVLLCAGLVLVFVGTLAQVDEGLYQAQVRYFRSWVIWRPTVEHSTWPILLPGGYLIGSMLLLNLVSAHIKRFQFTTKKIGIHLIHGGIMLLLLGQLLTDMLSQESAMRLSEGMSSHYSEDFRASELALIDVSKPGSDEVFSVPESELARKGEINDPALPVILKVHDYWPNCAVDLLPPPQAMPVAADHGSYTNYSVLPVPADVEASDQFRLAALVEIVPAKGASSTFLVPSKSDDNEPDQVFSADGHAYTIGCLFAPMLGGNLLAVSKAGDMGGNSMVTFPEAELKKKGVLENAALPFKLRVLDFWPKCRIYPRPASYAVVPKVTEGNLSGTFVTPGAPVTDSEHRNLPGAVIEFLDKKNHASLGTWLLWTGTSRSTEKISLEGRPFQFAFQFKRYYRPYRIGLEKFSHDQYKGTSIPSNFSSRVRLVNPLANEDRAVLIKMNSPLRYAGTTYYQAGFDEKRPDVTVLEVVANPGWLTPYFACVLVAFGLIYQFSTHLFGFAARRKTA
jgi:hypothetical protein